MVEALAHRAGRSGFLFDDTVGSDPE